MVRRGQGGQRGLEEQLYVTTSLLITKQFSQRKVIVTGAF